MPKVLTSRAFASKPVVPTRSIALRANNAWTKRLHPCRASRVADYVSGIKDSEVKGDWVRAFELVTEARALKLELPNDTTESAVRTYLQGGQIAKGIEMFDSLVDSGYVPQSSTTVALVGALAKHKQAERAVQLLKQLSSSFAPGELSKVYNSTARVCARQGSLELANSLLEELMATEGIEAERETFDSLAVAYLAAGMDDKAELVLEYRDYL